MLISYGKLGRSMPLTLDACGTLGGDIEMTATLVALARSRPQDTFVLLGRNSGHTPAEAGLPGNVINMWDKNHTWADALRDLVRRVRVQHDITASGLTVAAQRDIVGFLDELTQDEFMRMDAHVFWVGQHGTTNAPIPKVSDRTVLTKPYDWSIFYASYILRGINAWRDIDPLNREEIWLNADPRNYHKMRDLKWPLRHPILTQYEFTNNIKHERYDDIAILPTGWSDTHLGHGVWESTVRNVYSRIELNALVPGTPSGDLITFNRDWDNRDEFGIVINEARAIGVRPEMTRLRAMIDWVAPLRPSWVYGTWSERSTVALARHGIKTPIVSLPWRRYVPTIQTVRATFTTPSSGSHWATTKPWEAFGAGVVCFFHPEYDKQGHILADAPDWLRAWLRVRTPEELKLRVAYLSTSAGRSDWETIITAQREHFDRAMSDLTYLKMINERLEAK